MAARRTCASVTRWNAAARGSVAEARCDVPKFAIDGPAIFIAVARFEIRRVTIAIRPADRSS